MLHLVLIALDSRLTSMFAWSQGQLVKLTVHLTLWLSAVERVNLYPTLDQHQLLEPCHLHPHHVS